MGRVHDLERALAKAEGWLCVVLVMLMLVLAGYNVIYRNLLVPLQTHWAHSGPVQTAEGQAPDAGKATPAEGKSSGAEKKEAGGFGGAFGAAPEEGTGGIEGEIEGEDDLDAFDEEEGDDGEDADAGDDEGFGGAFGKPAKPDQAVDEDVDELLADNEFENLPDITAVAEADEAAGEPVGGPPPPGSFADRGAQFIDAIKLDWIDVFLRQLVIIVSFLGAAIATQRKKHINIDALSKLLDERKRRYVDVATNLLAVGVCAVLAVAGQRLVEIGREYPRQIVPFAQEWMFQLMFPLGFGLLAVHFGVRLLEAATGTAPPSTSKSTAATDPLEGPPSSDAVRRVSSPADEDDADDDDEDESDSVTSVESQEETMPQDAEAQTAARDPEAGEKEGPR